MIQNFFNVRPVEVTPRSAVADPTGESLDDFVLAFGTGSTASETVKVTVNKEHAFQLAMRILRSFEPASR